MFIAGIDGGGSHTRLELRNEQNEILRREECGPFNINSIGEDAFRALLRQIFAVCEDMGQCASICFGAAGISNPRMRLVLAEELELAGFRGTWKLCGDQEIALRGAMDCPGVAVIVGTGSICFGKNGAGETARSGGYGHLIDDGGSGYALGRDVLGSAVRLVDGRAKNSGILRAVLDKLGTGPEGIVPFVYSPNTGKADIAAFAPIALEQAYRGDPEAWKILHREAQELYELVAAVQETLNLHGCRIALLGGLLTSENCYRQAVAEKLTFLGTVVPPAHDALWGAAQMAWEQMKTE